MSYNTNKTYFYKIYGRDIQLWKYVETGGVSELAGYKIRLPDSYYGSQLIYPNETIVDGLMFEGTAYIKPFVDVDPNELDDGDNPTLTEESATLGTLDEESHVNLNRFLSLAVVDYIRAMKGDLSGDIQLKEYYMKEFWKKIGDNDSNKRNMSFIFPSSPFAIR